MLREKVFKMFIVGTGANFDYALENNVGGVIFFTDDIQSKDSFKNLINRIKSYYNDFNPILSIDQEGGRVERTENIRKERFLSPMFAYQKGQEYLSEQTELILSELKSFGINMNFAPCLDVNSNPNNPIIGERAFSDKTEDVCRGWDIVKPIYDKFEITPVIKHFPGHGDADTDSHLALPEINLTIEEMDNVHIYPFRHAIQTGAKVVMVAHLHCSCFDKDVIPTSLSKNCIGYLRNNLNFNGIIVSDDMYMKGLSKYNMTEACLMGINAGINMFIYRNSSDETINVIEDIIKLAQKDEKLREKIEYSYNKISHIL